MVLRHFLVRCAIAVAPATAAAQGLDVRLEGRSGVRLGGALVALVDSTDRVHIEVLEQRKRPGLTGRLSRPLPRPGAPNRIQAILLGRHKSATWR